ncbi:MAG: hypothetical protein WAK58_09195 [Trebonia sp.]
MEFIVEDATFVTMAPAGRAESMLVRDGRIAAIGPTAPCAPWRNLMPRWCGWTVPR